MFKIWYLGFARMDEEDMRGPQTWGQQEDRNPYYGSMVRLYNKTKDDNSNFYVRVPEVHIMYLTVSSWLLINFVIGGERPEQGD